MSMMDKDQTEAKVLLAISAHPDDVEFTSGGSLARWVAEGWRVHLVVCTDGSKGSHDPLVQPRELARLRRQEQEAAGKWLGITQMVWANYPDGELSGASDLVEWLTEIFRRVRPYRLLSWDPWKPYQLHPDHRAAGLAVLDAVLAAGNPHYFPSQLAAGLRPHRVAEVYLFGSDQPDVWVDITATLEAKLAAIKHHSSQIDNAGELVASMSHCNRDYGARSGYAYAEAFKVLHPFCDT
jgi:LmbE family N-acetylglucosaminyl deacetylase